MSVLLTAEDRQHMRATATLVVQRGDASGLEEHLSGYLLRALDDIDALERQVTHGERERQTVADAATAHAKWTRERIATLERERDEARALILALRVHAKECGWQDVDDPIKDLLEYAAALARAQEPTP